jgi:hypothetical protein
MSSFPEPDSCRFVQILTIPSHWAVEPFPSNSLVRKRSRVRFPSWAPRFPPIYQSDTGKDRGLTPVHKSRKNTRILPREKESIRNRFVQTEKPPVGGLHRISTTGVSAVLALIIDDSKGIKSQDCVWGEAVGPAMRRDRYIDPRRFSRQASVSMWVGKFTCPLERKHSDQKHPIKYLQQRRGPRREVGNAGKRLRELHRGTLSGAFARRGD